MSGITGGAHLVPRLQLIEDKKNLGDKCEAVVAELKQGDQRRKDREVQMREQHELVSPFPLHPTPPSLNRASFPGLRAEHGSWACDRTAQGHLESPHVETWEVAGGPSVSYCASASCLTAGDQETPRADERHREGAQGKVGEREDPEDQGDHRQGCVAAQGAGASWPWVVQSPGLWA